MTLIYKQNIEHKTKYKMKKAITEEQKKERKLKKLRADYNKVCSEVDLSGKTREEQVREMVLLATAIQGEICKCSDYIKVDKLDEASQLTSIDKSTWLDFVRIASLKDVGKLQEKAVSKFEADFERRLLITNLRKSFLESYMSSEDMKITDEDNYKYEPFDDYKSDDFKKIMEDAAQKRIYINTVLKPRYKEIANAAIYITDFGIKPSEFKELVDWEYYKEGGYPAPQSPSKIWKVFERYDHALRLLKAYAFADTANALNKEFGLSVSLQTPQPVDHPWEMLAQKRSLTKLTINI